MKAAIIYLEKVIHYGLYLILLTPLLLWWNLDYPFVTAKVLAFQTIVEVVFGAWLILLLLGGHAVRSTQQDSPVVRFSSLSIFLGVYLGYSLLSAVFGVDFKLGLWGMPDRQDGLVLLIHFLGWLLVLQWFFRNRDDRADSATVRQAGKSRDHLGFERVSDFTRYLNFSFWVSMLVAFSVFYQWLAITVEPHFKVPNLIPYALLGEFGARFGGVFGNPTFLGPYLLFHFFYGFYYLRGYLTSDREYALHRGLKKKQTTAQSWRGKIALAPVTFILLAQVLMVVAILLGKTRALILALAAGIVFLAFLLIFSQTAARTLRITLTVAVTLTLLSGFVAWQFRDHEILKKVVFFQRLTQVSLTDRSIGSRLLVWESALKSVWDHPVIGLGHNNAYFALNKYYNPKHIVYEYVPMAGSGTTWFDKSHNAYLDILVEKGIVGIVLLLALIAVVSKMLWRMNNAFLTVCLASGFVSYGISNLVAFDSFGSLFGCYLFLSVLAARDSANTPIEQANETFRRRKTETLRIRGWDGLGIFRKCGLAAVVGAVLLGVYFNVQNAMAMSAYAEAQRVIPRDFTGGLQLYQKALSHVSPYKAKMELRLALTIAEAVINRAAFPNREHYLDLAVKFARKAVEAHPSDVATHISLCDLFNNLALYDKKYTVEAERHGLKALELSPMRQEALFYLARTYLIRNEPSRAVALSRQLVDASPDLALTHWFLGLALIANDQREEAKEELGKALRMGYKFRNVEESEKIRSILGEKEFAELMTSK